MKAVVLDIEEKHAILLNQDGTFVRVENKEYEIGQSVEFRPRTMRFRYGLVACIALFVIVFGLGTFAYFDPYTYVSFDVNPSVEFTVNRFDRVIKVRVINEENEQSLDKAVFKDINHKRIDTAIKKTLEEVKESGYLSEESKVVIATSNPNKNKAQSLANRLEEVVSKEEREVAVETVCVDKNKLDDAREYGITPGKLTLIEKLKDALGNEEFDINDWTKKSVKEIVNATNEVKKNEKEKRIKPGDDPKNADDLEDEKEEVKEEKKDIKDAKKEEEKQEKEEEKKQEKEEKERERQQEKEEKERQKQEEKEEKEKRKREEKEEKEKQKREEKEEKERQKQEEKEEKERQKQEEKEKKEERKRENKEEIKEKILKKAKGKNKEIK
jgi:hypothetical protein